MTRFSRVNECMGAIAGDELLITFARRLFSALRAGDMLARTGGDEFGILMRLDRGPRRRAPARPSGSSACWRRPFRLSELEIRVDCSIGCALLSGSVELAEEVLRNAQFALKRAKHSGQTQVYEPNQAQAARRRFSIETELRRAIEDDELTLAFQPLIDLPTGQRLRLRGAGALGPCRARLDLADRIHSGRRGIGADRLARPLGARCRDPHAGRVGRASGPGAAALCRVNLSAIQIARDDIAAAPSVRAATAAASPATG